VTPSSRAVAPGLLLPLFLLLPSLARAAGPDAGDTAWVLTSTALVLFKTLPGLALFYGGLVRAKNVLSVLMQCFAITAVVSLLWLLGGYGLAFGPDVAGVVGDLS
jgi:Amt family ammonium transporter